jgi:hypothetical protein
MPCVCVAFEKSCISMPFPPAVRISCFCDMQGAGDSAFNASLITRKLAKRGGPGAKVCIGHFICLLIPKLHIALLEIESTPWGIKMMDKPPPGCHPPVGCQEGGQAIKHWARWEWRCCCGFEEGETQA